MVNAIYLILVILVGLYSLAAGFRKGITHQLTHLLGFSFGAVAARVLTPDFSHHFNFTASLSQAPEFADFTANLVCASVIYAVAYAFFTLFTPLFKLVSNVIPVGIFNRILGSFFALTKNLLWLSIAFNLMLCISPASRLLIYEKANDGNLVAAVMAITPAILGCYGAEDFAHFNQLKHAKTISCNFKASPDVIYI